MIRVLVWSILWTGVSGGAVAQQDTPEVALAATHPLNGAVDVLPSSALHLRFTDAIDPQTLDSIRLLRADDDQLMEVSVRCSTDLTNASITVVPVELLKSGQRYHVTTRGGLLDADGRAVRPFALTFTVGAEAPPTGGLTFDAVRFDDTRSMTTVVFGPDRRVYAASAFGELVCWSTDENGRPGERTRLAQDEQRSRQYIDLEWDPTATADNLLMWASYSERLRPRADPRCYFTGTIVRLLIRGNRVVEEQTVVTGLPHGREVQGGHETLPHQPNGLCFRDGRLYQSIGSTSSSGGPPNWGLPEQFFSACVVEIDYKRIGPGGLDLFPGNPSFATRARDGFIRHYATGVRNAVELLAHSNGRLYTAVNINDRGQRGDGVPDDPDIPGDQNALIKQITPDHESLLVLERGRHYGFPNPSLGNYVLNGGNPTAGEDPFEISDYPVGTQPETGFAPELMFPLWRWGGTSPDGMIEYSPQFRHPLRSAILCCFYSANDIAVMLLGEDGLPVSVDKLRSRTGKLKFTGPLDLTQDPKTGSVYVADFGRQSEFGADGSLVWLRPSSEPVPQGRKR